MPEEQAKKIAASLLTASDKQVRSKIKKYDLEDQFLILFELGIMQDRAKK